MTTPELPPSLLRLVAPPLAEIRAYTTPKKKVAVKLDANESPLSLPEEARRRIAEVVAAAPLHRYPDGRASALRAALCDRLGCRGEELLLGVGSDEVIALLMRALGAPPEGRAEATVLFPEPTFVMYTILGRVQGMRPVGVPMTPDFRIDLPRFLEAIEAERPNLIFLATPNNPTARAFEEASLRAIVEAAPDSLVIIDEAYAPYSARSYSDWCERYPNVGVMGTLSKVGFAALRVGWIRMHPTLGVEVDKVRAPYNLSAPAQAVATLVLEELWPTVEASVAEVVAERARLAEALAALPGIEVLPSDANFLLLYTERPGAELAAGLRERGVGIRSFKEERLLHHVRVTVGTSEQSDRLVEALQEELGSPKSGS